jgi:hypothetical protein
LADNRSLDTFSQVMKFLGNATITIIVQENDLFDGSQKPYILKRGNSKVSQLRKLMERID